MQINQQVTNFESLVPSDSILSASCIPQKCRSPSLWVKSGNWILGKLKDTEYIKSWETLAGNLLTQEIKWISTESVIKKCSKKKSCWCFSLLVIIPQKSLKPIEKKYLSIAAFVKTRKVSYKTMNIVCIFISYQTYPIFGW